MNTSQNSNLVDEYRARIARAPDDVGLLAEFCFQCFSTAPETVVQTLEQLCTLPEQPQGNHLHWLGLLVFFKQTWERRRRGLPPENAVDLADLEPRFVSADVARWQAASKARLDRKPNSLPGTEMHCLALLSGEQPWLAEPFLENLRRAGRPTPISAARFSPLFRDSLEARAASLDTLPAVTWLHAQPPPGENVLFTACDAVYFEKYGRTLIHSVLRDGQGPLVVHLFDVTAPEAENIAASLGNPSVLHFSLEWTGLRSGEVTAQAKAYYHAVRYVRFLEFVEAGRPRAAWLLDTDLVFNRSPETLFELLDGHDLGLWLMPARVDIQSRVGAGMVGITPSPLAMTYLRKVAGYLVALLEEGALIWGADQIALFLVLKELIAKGETPDVAAVPATIYDGSFSADAALWPGKKEPVKGPWA